MGRNRNDERLDQVLAFIQQNPDQQLADIGQYLNLDSQTMQRSLAHLEARGDLLQEDDKGYLRWFGKRC
ncbi:MAG: helix-turn-helix domain-containing protein [Anaerolineae bacterium]